MASTQWSFDEFRLDLDNACLWHHKQMVPLSLKAFDVLQYLVLHANNLVTKDALLDAVWPEMAVSDVVVRLAIRELRQALGDTARTSRFIATIHGRGYRFLVPVTQTQPLPAAPAVHAAASPLPASLEPLPLPERRAQQASKPLVGRDGVLQHLGKAMARARQGTRQLCLLLGEPGIGKTAVVEAFAHQMSADPSVCMAYGQCIEHYGQGEAYMPVLEALNQLCRGPHGSRVLTVLRQCAPTWLAQMPWLLDPADRQRLQQELLGTTQARMLREFAEALDLLTGAGPVVLVLEDLHWSDHATIDLLSVLARRREAAQLFILGTYRPVEVILREHPLRTLAHDLQLHGQGSVLPLEFLSEEDVAMYVERRFPAHRFPLTLARMLHQHSDGNPLFLLHIVEWGLQRGMFARQEGQWTLQVAPEALAQTVPESVHQMLEQQILRLTPEEQRVLEAASVAGLDFSAAAVAAGLQEDLSRVEQLCEPLAQRHQVFMSMESTTWPDGTVATRYRFRHWLYQHVAYQRLGTVQRVHLHQRLGSRLAAAYASQTQEIAAELARHFTQGRDVKRAVQFLQQAAANAMQRHAPREAIGHLTTALDFVSTAPETPERVHTELALRLALGPALMTTEGYTAPALEQSYVRARALCQQLGDTPQLFPVLYGLGMFHHQRAEWSAALQIGQQLLTLAQREPQDRMRRVPAHYMLGAPFFWLGELQLAHQHCEAALEAYQAHMHHQQAQLYGDDPGISCRVYMTRILGFLGYPDRALAWSRETVALLDERARPFSLALARLGMAFIHQFRREAAAAQPWAEGAMQICEVNGFPFVLAWARALRGAALAAQGHTAEGITELRTSVGAHQALGATLGLPSLLILLAEAYAVAAQPANGLQALQEAQTVAVRSGERAHAAIWLRLHGQLLLQQSPESPQAQAAAEAQFLQARDIARQQRAKALELGVALSLAALWHQQGKRDAARQLLAPLYAGCTEGLATADLHDARQLLDTFTGMVPRRPGGRQPSAPV